ncbi:MAG TPA: UvrD-helicase domain-containing protein, partial [Chloroflexota bacterium]
MSLLDGLNAQQRDAVTAPPGPMLILAGPGSGKTRVIVHRVAYLLREGVSPSRIMAVTFTNKAARELHERLQGLVGRRVDGLTVGTFHSICARILRREGPHLGLDPGFLIYDESDQVDVVREVLRDLEVDEKRYAPRSILATISRAKGELLSPLAFSEHAEGHW